MIGSFRGRWSYEQDDPRSGMRAYSGLAHVWQWAGASNVAMSLWSVDDKPTQELMEGFVDGVMEGQAVDKALQAAMLNLRREHPSPSHWASFAVYGAPERLDKERP